MQKNCRLALVCLLGISTMTYTAPITLPPTVSKDGPTTLCLATAALALAATAASAGSATNEHQTSPAIKRRRLLSFVHVRFADDVAQPRQTIHKSPCPAADEESDQALEDLKNDTKK